MAIGAAMRLALGGIVCCMAATAAAQPVLPEMTGSAGRNAVSLAWVCQFKDVRAVYVLRATEKEKEFTVVGTVAHPDKGVQSFTDSRPATGRNCYKVSVTFKTGLTWSGNIYCVIVAASPKEAENGPVQVKSVIAKGMIVPTEPAAETKQAIPVKEAVPVYKKPEAAAPEKPIAAEEPAGLRPAHLSSRWITVDDDGNVHLDMPDDIYTHQYGIAFYDAGHHLITEIVRINSRKCIIDQLNFQAKRNVGFVVKIDGTVREEGQLSLGGK